MLAEGLEGAVPALERRENGLDPARRRARDLRQVLLVRSDIERLPPHPVLEGAQGDTGGLGDHLEGQLGSLAQLEHEDVEAMAVPLPLGARDAAGVGDEEVSDLVREIETHLRVDLGGRLRGPARGLEQAGQDLQEIAPDLVGRGPGGSGGLQDGCAGRSGELVETKQREGGEEEAGGERRG